jgi:drug/metabolite transporter (DMT)-like permease
MMEKGPLLYVMASAALFGISAPVAKVLLTDVPPVALAALLYLGAFIGLSLISAARAAITPREARSAPLVRKDVPWLLGAVAAGGVVAPIALMVGLTSVTGFAASLLLNLEGVSTALIAVAVFREHAGGRLWAALLLMTTAGVLLAWDPGQGGLGAIGPILIVLAMVCWGIDNNLTRQISGRDPVRIAQVKGIMAGGTSLAIALLLGWSVALTPSLLLALLLGALSYGVSLVLFIKALEGMGSSRTGAFFSLGPFVGAAVSIAFLGDEVTVPFFAAAVLMAVGVGALVAERHSHKHRHEEVVHEHLHSSDPHHRHPHPDGMTGPHSHEHVHEAVVHSHVHWPDQHHRHEHER